MALNAISARVLGIVAKSYQKAVVSRLNQYGLKYDDILNESDPDVILAVSRLPPDVKQAR